MSGRSGLRPGPAGSVRSDSRPGTALPLLTHIASVFKPSEDVFKHSEVIFKQSLRSFSSTLHVRSSLPWGSFNEGRKKSHTSNWSENN